jgi:hypothetical protein
MTPLGKKFDLQPGCLRNEAVENIFLESFYVPAPTGIAAAHLSDNAM